MQMFLEKQHTFYFLMLSCIWLCFDELFIAMINTHTDINLVQERSIRTYGFRGFNPSWLEGLLSRRALYAGQRAKRKSGLSPPPLLFHLSPRSATTALPGFFSQTSIHYPLRALKNPVSEGSCNYHSLTADGTISQMAL